MRSGYAIHNHHGSLMHACHCLSLRLCGRHSLSQIVWYHDVLWPSYEECAKTGWFAIVSAGRTFVKHSTRRNKGPRVLDVSWISRWTSCSSLVQIEAVYMHRISSTLTSLGLGLLSSDIRHGCGGCQKRPHARKNARHMMAQAVTRG